MEENTRLEKLIKIGQTVLGVVIGLGLLIGIWFFTGPIRADFSRKSDIINFLNKKSINNISEETLKEAERVMNAEEIQEFDISPLVSDYLYKVEQSSIYVSNQGTNLKVQEFNINNRWDTYKKDPSGNMNFTYLLDDCQFMFYLFTDRELDKVKEGTFLNTLVGKLEKILDHRDPNMTKGWYINKDICEKIGKKLKEGQYIINLPYDCYINITFPTVTYYLRTFTDVSLSNKGSKNKKYELNLTYDDGSTDICNTYMSFDHQDNWWHSKDMTIALQGVLYKYNEGTCLFYADGQY